MNFFPQVDLPDGRVLAFREYGDPKGEPVLFLHGFLSSSTIASFCNASALG